uniref:Uncharacterized protein n=1 Tax=Romanomermis culicivorax TaxID=13658 RepID=A0A915HV42_ROMCU
MEKNRIQWEGVRHKDRRLVSISLFIKTQLDKITTRTKRDHMDRSTIHMDLRRYQKCPPTNQSIYRSTLEQMGDLTSPIGGQERHRPAYVPNHPVGNRGHLNRKEIVCKFRNLGCISKSELMGKIATTNFEQVMGAVDLGKGAAMAETMFKKVSIGQFSDMGNQIISMSK